MRRVTTPPTFSRVLRWVILVGGVGGWEVGAVRCGWAELVWKNRIRVSQKVLGYTPPYL